MVASGYMWAQMKHWPTQWGRRGGDMAMFGLAYGERGFRGFGYAGRWGDWA